MHIPDTRFSKLTLTVSIERWPIAGVFTTSRGSKTEAVVVVAKVADGLYQGRGECVPYARYGEDAAGVARLMEMQIGKFADNISREELQHILPPGAARNALDCALWDLEAKQKGIPVWKLAEIAAPKILRTAFTISLAAPEVMNIKTREAVATHTLLKIKLGGDAADHERLSAVREAAPSAELITDANESWRAETLQDRMGMCEKFGITLVEQPLPAGDDAILSGLPNRILICADESAHVTQDIAGLAGKYAVVNIKLDKTGGLTEALRMYEAARKADMKVMVGCMVATSLSMAPAVLLAAGAEFVDLDGALLLAKDRENGLVYRGDTVASPASSLWG